jgi:hypothetical protein
MHELTDRLSTAKVLNITGSSVPNLAARLQHFYTVVSKTSVFETATNISMQAHERQNRGFKSRLEISGLQVGGSTGFETRP